MAYDIVYSVRELPLLRKGRGQDVQLLQTSRASTADMSRMQ
jgi:hypothetical protein